MHGICIQFWQMSHTITVRLPKELAQWLEDTAARAGVAQGQLVREQLEKARDKGKQQPFMRLAGCVRGAKNLSKRKGFSTS
jgi:hypothetical protein